MGKVNAIFLEQYVLFMMQDKMKEKGEFERLCAEEAERLKQEIEEQRKKKNVLSARIQKIKQQKFEVYQDYACGRADSFHSDEIMVKSIEKELEGLNELLMKLEASQINMESKREKRIAASPFAELSKEMIDRYVDKIVVYDEQHIEIFWKEKSGVT